MAYSKRFINLVYQWQSTIILLSGTVFGYVHVLLINSVYKLTAGSILFWLVLDPLMYYDVHCKCCYC